MPSLTKLKYPDVKECNYHHLECICMTCWRGVSLKLECPNNCKKTGDCDTLECEHYMPVPKNAQIYRNICFDRYKKGVDGKFHKVNDKCPN